MKINGSIETPRVDTTSGATPKPAEAGKPPVAASDEVSLSDRATQLGQLKAKLKADGAFDAAKVARLREAIAKGDYKVNAEVVADKLIADAKGLLTGKS
jgi:negative regulator of flagellin synthesis FlgM